MNRPTSIACASTLALLLVGGSCLWSLVRAMELCHFEDTGYWAISITRGSVCYIRVEGGTAIAKELPQWRLQGLDAGQAEAGNQAVSKMMKGGWDAVGVRVAKGKMIRRDAVLVIVPVWPVALLLLIPPGLWLIRHQGRRQRIRAGECPSCGYDPRATRSGVRSAGRSPAPEPHDIPQCD